ncbi:hypothetical protein [Actinoplanes sp. NPDC051494]|uniref:hypothetical protein n=1 Tax=Actinoplanes sp. NPDC051494 TaxID=3363907 RepID=UPI0037AA060F
MWAAVAAVAGLNLALALSSSARWISPIVALAALLAGITFLLCPRNNAPPAENDHAASPVTPPGGWAPERAADDTDFDEDLELTVWVGKDADGDHVLERRLTRPHHAIEGRTLTLISPYVESHARATPVAPHLTVDTGAVTAHWQSGTTPGRGIVLFDTPAREVPLRWNMSYRIPGGLWNPLRSIGFDVLRYDVRNFPIGRFSVRFVVDRSAHDIFVRERSGRGTISESARDAEGNVIRVWTSHPAAPVEYEWDLSIEWNDNRPDGPAWR